MGKKDATWLIRVGSCIQKFIVQRKMDRQANSWAGLNWAGRLRGRTSSVLFALKGSGVVRHWCTFPVHIACILSVCFHGLKTMNNALVADLELLPFCTKFFFFYFFLGFIYIYIYNLDQYPASRKKKKKKKRWWRISFCMWG